MEKEHENGHEPFSRIFARLRSLGIQAEDAMMAATKGINTHKGLIFSLAILNCSLGYMYANHIPYSPDMLLSINQKLVADVLEDFREITAENARTNGERLYALYGMKGARGEALSGYATVLKTALPILKDGKVAAALPAGTVTDFPRFRYRGFMIDVGRHFFPVSYLKQMIDLMALHNINYFHWHLTEDQGWRIEIKKYPKLTEIGSKRDSTIIDWETKKFDGKPHSGFYTQDEAREIVRYAADRFITVVPEIDLPGHTTAALASYPELGCTGGPYKVLCSFGVFPDVLCAGNDQTLQFTKDVLDEIMDIFPSEYIHIGGDECPKSRWEKCPKCQAKIKELGIKTLPKHSKENQLQTYFMSELEKEINAHGRRMLGWDEVLEGGLTPNSTIMSWRGIQGGIEAARDRKSTRLNSSHVSESRIPSSA